MADPIIRAEGLCHSYGTGALRKQILYDISLEIRQGEVVLLTGPSGSGKTTLLSLMGGLRSTQQGSLRILDREMKSAWKWQVLAIRRQIGYIFQAHNLLGFLTARQNVKMSLEQHPQFRRGNINKLAADMLAQVGLGDKLDAYPENLSGGQKQRVAIARALAAHPRLVLADEPTAALDKQSGREVVSLMQKLAREQGSTILMVTHDNRILDIADRILQIEDGRLARELAVSALNP